MRRTCETAAGSYRVHATLDGFDPVVRRIAVEAGGAAALDLTLSPSRLTESVVVTARRVEEEVQEVPIPVSVLSGKLVAESGAFNVNRLKEMIPTVQFYSSNPRIRLMGILLVSSKTKGPSASLAARAVAAVPEAPARDTPR